MTLKTVLDEGKRVTLNELAIYFKKTGKETENKTKIPQECTRIKANTEREIKRNNEEY